MACLCVLASALAGCDGITGGPYDIPRAVPSPVLAGDGLRLASVSSGFFHTCGLDPDGRAWCWGDNAYRQLGVEGPNVGCDGTSECLMRPVRVATELRFTVLSTAHTYTCALTTAGEAVCWGGGYGSGGAGNLGTGQMTRSAAPVAVAGGHRFQAITAGVSVACGLTTDGAALCWGRGGLVGDGGSGQALAPVAVSGGHRFTAIAAGGDHVCGLVESGEALCWGGNRYGQTGTGAVARMNPATSTFDPLLVPTPVAGDLRFRAITAGGDFTCGLTTASALACWGFNHVGQHGTGTPSAERPVPTLAPGAGTFASIAAGTTHVCGVRTGGEAACWGGNWFGALGRGRSTAADYDDGTEGQALPVKTRERFASISGGGSHTCGVATDGRVWCWGDKARGQLGVR